MPIVERFIAVYKLWDEFRDDFPKKTRYTLGEKIDEYFIQIIELLFIASYLVKQEKIPYLRRASVKLDSLKLFLRISWELKVLDNKKFILLSEHLDEMGKMLGGWERQLTKTSAY
ncbi:MAG: hypothetical protein A2931_00250 [Candidatus Niyogibacteria bacterium RIFCSPLOWO2_01_FULL_45_48]|uniref:bAvd-like domain-containing protein n=2 Tax=Candidatus Niyogiibacteriota TaxID=1817912 RepID=A0A1G2EXS7_9BACT|nr:MAG: hypothetical protein A2931_00250 [Candidatus Niyogibacteria bacterium RIFCSPLOWO2_01_FULL_45_48]OGZ30573.1 MAG: hypothetical protein A3J00_03840 [Candidatus Niyogibacteria bacterium RIFCSPLOWO2_02_FULL_45_13]